VWCQLSTAAAQASSNNVSSTLFPPMGNRLFLVPTHLIRIANLCISFATDLIEIDVPLLALHVFIEEAEAVSFKTWVPWCTIALHFIC